MAQSESSVVSTVSAFARILEVPLSSIKLGTFTPRLGIDEAYVDRLASSIKELGLLTSPMVRRHPYETGQYQVIDGENRVRACLKLGLFKINVEVLEANDRDASLIALGSNVQKGKSLDAIEVGLYLQKILEAYGGTQEAVGAKLGKSQPWINNRVVLANRASAELKEAIITRVINFSQARAISALEAELQRRVLEKVKGENLTARQTRVLVKRLIENQSDDVFSLSKNELIDVPKEIQTLIQSSGEANLFIEDICPICGAQVVVNWVDREVKWESGLDEQ